MADQAALHGVIDRMQGLGLEPVEVRRRTRECAVPAHHAKRLPKATGVLLWRMFQRVPPIVLQGGGIPGIAGERPARPRRIIPQVAVSSRDGTIIAHAVLARTPEACCLKFGGRYPRLTGEFAT